MLRKLIIPSAILLLAFGVYHWMNSPDAGSGRTTNAPVTTPSSVQKSANGNEGQTKSSANQTENSASQPESSAGQTESSSEKSAQSSANRRGSMGPPRVLAKQGATSVEVLTALPAQRMAEITLFGTIEARQQATLTATSSAEVTSINVHEGDLINAGDSLVTLSADSAEEALRQRQAALTELDARIRNEQLKYQNDLAALKIDHELLAIAKNSVDRFTSLNAQQLSSSSDYEDALRAYQAQLLSVQSRELTIAQYEDLNRQLNAQRNSFQSQIRQSQELVDDLDVRAPFTGLVAKLEVVSGQELRSGDNIAEIYDPAQLALYVRVPLRYRLDQIGLSDISASDSLGQRWQALSIRPINESGAQRLTLVPADNQAIYQLPGSHLSVTVTYPLSEPSIEVPFTAIYDQQRVYVVDQGNVVNQGNIIATEVRILGHTRAGYLIATGSLTSKIEAGSQLVVTRMKNPLTGMAVKVANPAGGGQP